MTYKAVEIINGAEGSHELVYTDKDVWTFQLEARRLRIRDRLIDVMEDAALMAHKRFNEVGQAIASRRIKVVLENGDFNVFITKVSLPEELHPTTTDED